MHTTLAPVIIGMDPPQPPGSRVAAGREPAPHTADLRIDGWLVQPTLNLLTREDVSLRLRAQLMDLLLCLASRPGKVFAREELVADVWEGRWVAESAISRCVSELRAALGDDAQRPRVIETITKRGYRLIAPVQAVAPPAEPPPARTATAARNEAPRSFWQRLKLSAVRAAAGFVGGV